MNPKEYVTCPSCGLAIAVLDLHPDHEGRLCPGCQAHGLIHEPGFKTPAGETTLGWILDGSGKKLHKARPTRGF